MPWSGQAFADTTIHTPGDVWGRRGGENRYPALSRTRFNRTLTGPRPYLIRPSSLRVSANTTSLLPIVLVNSSLVCQAGLSMFLAK